ncbi:Protein of unknown function [Bacillus wiedmannii]|nr:Protein of unknown function [Bacillus wiedmannii]
MDGIVR